MRHPKVVFKRYYHSLFFMCSHGDYTDRYLRGYLLKINVENTSYETAPWMRSDEVGPSNPVIAH